MINDVFLGWAPIRASLLEREDLIVEGLAPFFSNRAKYFTINIGDRIGLNYTKDQLFVELFYKHKYEVIVHDPRFFLWSWITVAFPFLLRTIEQSEKIGYPLVLTEVEQLNRPQDPCNEDKKYNFQVFILFLAVSK